jgi:MFS family permease
MTMISPIKPPTEFGKWMALTAALLGWMFDGFEMGLFPLVARPALKDLMPDISEAEVTQWFAVITAVFLVGAATGGVLFGWLGDRIGRVRSMSLSILAYALFSGLCGLARSPVEIAILRFLAALGMGGEWALGVALVMEIWPNRSRAFLAGLIGSAANMGYLIVALLSLGLQPLLGHAREWLLALHLPESTVDSLVRNSGWRLLMLFAASPALLTFFIRLAVPESARWLEERERGSTSNWATRDLLGVLLGAAGAVALITLWAFPVPPVLQVVGSIAALLVLTGGYLYPVRQFLNRMTTFDPEFAAQSPAILRRMLVAALISGVPLMGTWATIQLAPTWADKLAETAGGGANAKAWTQFSASLGATLGTIVAALLGDLIGRRLAYCVLCVGSMGTILYLFQLHDRYDTAFLLAAGLCGGVTASFYGWLPLYLPELFRTRVRATGQGFGFNFGRILAALGVLQLPNLMRAFGNSYPNACTTMGSIYLAGLFVIWLAPETRGKPLPD